MTPFQAVLLALVQAATEFLPVSSSGHLILAAAPARLERPGARVRHRDEHRHAARRASPTSAPTSRASRAASFASFADRERLRAGGAARPGRSLFGTIPAAIAGLLIKDWVATVARGWQVVAVNAVVYGLLLARRRPLRPEARGPAGELGRREGLLIGCAQALALVPGTSRSGVTMTAALALGYTREAAARFSFLLAVPIGLLVGAKQVVDFARGEPLGVPLDRC